MFQKCCITNAGTRFPRIRIILLVFIILGTECTVPEASQEGLLHSFKSYSDVVTFHYAVPKEVARATWQFAAFMDGKNCPQRQVHIYLQWGSYPVISINNLTFPENMYPTRDHTLVVSTFTIFEPKTTAIIPVYGPMPGDWFVGAYLSHWDEKVQQQGLGHKCHYSIGSIALWTQINNIENIPIGYKQTLRTKDTTSYYKIYIPSGTWNFQLHVWGCNLTLYFFKNIHQTCIKNIILKGRMIPIYNHTHPSGVSNLTSLDSYTFTEPNPYEESYYYLMVVSDSIIEFNVQVTMSECPIRTTSNPVIKQYLDAPSFSKALAELHIKDLTKHLNHQNLRNNITSMSSNINDLKYQFRSHSEGGNMCIPRYQLIRVKHAQAFSGVYLLQGREWLTSWIVLTEQHPVIVQFNILPFVDIGGTLEITAHLEMDRAATRQRIDMKICIERGRIASHVKGEIICVDPRMLMNLSSFGNQDATLLIPYPQPDTWYITLQAKCYVENRVVNCEMEEIVASLDIRTRQCVFAGNFPCGHHGICQEIRRDILYYTACNCYEGYKGWGCTDATGVSFKSSLVLATTVLTLSNGFFIPAIYLAIRRQLYTEGLVYLATMVFSSLYHACDQHVVTYCVAKYEVLQYCDFFTSILAFWVTLVAMAELPTRFTSLCHMIGVLLIAFAVESNRTGLSSIIIPLATGTMIALGAYTYRSYKLKKCKKPSKPFKLLIGLLLVIIGVLLFSLVETEANYHFVHSAWHMIIAISLIFLLPPAPTLNSSISSSSSFSNDSELMDYKDTPGTPIFTVTSGQESLIVSRS